MLLMGYQKLMGHHGPVLTLFVCAVFVRVWLRADNHNKSCLQQLVVATEARATAVWQK